MEKNMKKNIYVELNHFTVQQKFTQLVNQLYVNNILQEDSSTLHTGNGKSDPKPASLRAVLVLLWTALIIPGGLQCFVRMHTELQAKDDASTLSISFTERFLRRKVWHF